MSGIKFDQGCRSAFSSLGVFQLDEGIALLFRLSFAVHVSSAFGGCLPWSLVFGTRPV